MKDKSQATLSLLPPTVDAKDYIALAIEAAFPGPHDRDVRVKYPSSTAFRQFLIANQNSDIRRDFLDSCRCLFFPPCFNLSDVLLVARSAMLSDLDFKTGSVFLNWYFSSGMPINDFNVAHVFCQMMDQGENSFFLSLSALREFINRRLKDKPSLYWTSDALHRMFVGGLKEFCSDANPLEKRITLIPWVSRIVRRVVEAEDPRYRQLFHECWKASRALMGSGYIAGPELYEFTGLLDWAEGRLMSLILSQGGHEMGKFETYLERVLCLSQFNLDVNIRVEFSRFRNPCGDGMYYYTYSIRIKPDVDGIKDPAMAERWVTARGDLQIRIGTDYPICSDRHIDAMSSKRFTSVPGSPGDDVEADFLFMTTSRHCRLKLTIGAGAEVIFSGLTFYLPQDDIPELLPPWDGAVDVTSHCLGVLDV